MSSFAGRIIVDFAGTHEEARQFASANGLCVARIASGASHEMPSLSAPFQSRRALRQAQEKLARLGWDEDSQQLTFRVYSGGRK